MNDAAGGGPELLNRRRLAISAVVIVVGIGAIYFVLPKLAGLDDTWGEIRRGNPRWLALGATLEALSIGSYAALFRAVFSRGVPRIDWKVSVEVPLAGIAAIRLVAAAGAGGVAVTVWALRRAGMSARTIGSRMVANIVIQYSVYLLALIVCGVGLYAGAFAGGGSFALTIVPAIVSVALGALVLGMGLIASDFERRLKRLAKRGGWTGRLAARLASVPATLSAGVRTAVQLAREKPLGLVAAIGYWGFDVAVLGFCLRAFGEAVTPAIVVMGYFLGTLGSLLPLPGGVGGVEGGMIGAFAAFGVPGGRAVAGVLAYRAISFWLPTLPGIGGYLALRADVRHWQDDDAARDGEHDRGGFQHRARVRERDSVSGAERP
ncbi:MAG: lysylphosphatidylglycerol synthase transmembrane domain-containing protein [Solirubrobacteraceae bacterium]